MMVWLLWSRVLVLAALAAVAVLLLWAAATDRP